ncbi:hypothetical protein N9W21_03030, partial [Shewanella sp.]|nr:hypothetical protein [Shewanella sp.]
GSLTTPYLAWRLLNMLNLKTAFFVAMLSLSTSVCADEMIVDTTKLESTISANLTESMELMQLELSEELNTMLVADQFKADKITETAQLAE